MRKLILALALAGSPAMASTAAIMHRDPGCGCCEKWAAQVRKGLGKTIRAVDASMGDAFGPSIPTPAEAVFISR